MYAAAAALGVIDANRVPPTFRKAVREFLGHGGSEARSTVFMTHPRTVEHAVARLNRGWYAAGADIRSMKDYNGPDPIRRPVGYLTTVLLAQDCTRQDCERGSILASGEDCTLCGARAAEAAAEKVKARWEAEAEEKRAARQAEALAKEAAGQAEREAAAAERAAAAQAAAERAAADAEETACLRARMAAEFAALDEAAAIPASTPSEDTAPGQELRESIRKQRDGRDTTRHANARDAAALLAAARRAEVPTPATDPVAASTGGFGEEPPY
ncbi:hypothetical protein [Streptomyces omiyaensis]|uniref:hypothetical protein n=1 Tax=Streptomyces omiyaensis TaxID=68247 RepID=UPI0036FF9A22